ncbi:MAG TPA: hypothetical protein VMJ72_01040 [Candidatus Paceibacterota bacterium]|nr:hypothetical protein [Candidatus Paceibacterota bacterium]
MIMDRRLVFPISMFVLAAVSFGYGIWQYVAAGKVQTAANARLAFVMSTIEHSRSSRAEKQELYAAVFQGLPKSPSMFGVDLSGSFAAPPGGDQCTSDGQRAVCHALHVSAADPGTIGGICGLCNPK